MVVVVVMMMMMTMTTTTTSYTELITTVREPHLEKLLQLE
jgi:hypothetical protein